MRAGRLDRLVTVEQPVHTVDPTYGTRITTWEPLATTGSPPEADKFYASVQDVLPGRSEGVQNGVVLNRDMTRIRMRWRNDITPDMRITVHGSTDVIYQIIAGPVEVDGRERMIELTCEKYSS